MVVLGGSVSVDGEPAAATVACGRRGSPCTARAGRRGLSYPARLACIFRNRRGRRQRSWPRCHRCGRAPRRRLCRGPVTGHDRQRLVHQAAAAPPQMAPRHRDDIWLACAAGAVPDAHDLGAQLRGGHRAGKGRTEHAADGGDRRLGSRAAGGVAALVRPIQPGDDAAIAAVLAREHPPSTPIIHGRRRPG
jgi:hypothetical protein